MASAFEDHGSITIPIGEFRISEANAGHFLPIRQTNMIKLQMSYRKKGKFETLKGFGGVKAYLQA